MYSAAIFHKNITDIACLFLYMFEKCHYLCSVLSRDEFHFDTDDSEFEDAVLTFPDQLESNVSSNNPQTKP